MSAVDVARPVLICGVGRSGTSLLHSMLNAHPALAFPPETHFFRRYVAPRRARARFERGRVQDFAARLAQDEDFTRVDLAAHELLAPERDGALDLARVFERLLARVAAREGKLRVGDKDPRNIDHLDALAAAFPGAFVLHVIRDPREVLLSRTRAAWSRGRPWWQHALLAEDQLRRGRASGAQRFGARYLEVRYEDLVSAPEATLRRVAAHIDVDYAESMLDFGASAASLIDGRERAWKKETLGPLLGDNIEKWRTNLSATQIRFVERVSVEAFERLNYQRSTPAVDGMAQRCCIAVAPLARRAAREAFRVRRTLEAIG